MPAPDSAFPELLGADNLLGLTTWRPQDMRQQKSRRHPTTILSREVPNAQWPKHPQRGLAAPWGISGAGCISRCPLGCGVSAKGEGLGSARALQHPAWLLLPGEGVKVAPAGWELAPGWGGWSQVPAVEPQPSFVPMLQAGEARCTAEMFMGTRETAGGRGRGAPSSAPLPLELPTELRVAVWGAGGAWRLIPSPQSSGEGGLAGPVPPGVSNCHQPSLV